MAWRIGSRAPGRDWCASTACRIAACCASLRGGAVTVAWCMAFLDCGCGRFRSMVVEDGMPPLPARESGNIEGVFGWSERGMLD